MCFACTVIPMTISFSARAHAKHIERRDKALAHGEIPPKFVRMDVIAKGLAVAGLATVALVYHATTVEQPAIFL